MWSLAVESIWFIKIASHLLKTVCFHTNCVSIAAKFEGIIWQCLSGHLAPFDCPRNEQLSY